VALIQITPGIAIDEPYAHCMFQFRNRSGNGGLAHVESDGRLVHAAGPRDSHQNMKVEQFHATRKVITGLHTGSTYSEST